MAVITLTQADQGKPVPARVGDTLQLALPENPTTGYRWAIDQIDSSVLSPTGSNYAPAPTSALGAGGQRTFTFQAVKAGNSPVQLKLWRQWEGDKSVAQRFGVNVAVQG